MLITKFVTIIDYISHKTECYTIDFGQKIMLNVPLRENTYFLNKYSEKQKKLIASYLSLKSD